MIPTGAIPSQPHPNAVGAPGQERHDELRQVAMDLEASFLAEMLKHAGFGEARSSFGGGAGEDQFASLLRIEHAQAIAERGGIGLAEHLFQSLLSRSGSQDGDAT